MQPALDLVLHFFKTSHISKLISDSLCLHQNCFTEVIKEKGIENVTVEDLVAGVTPKGRGRLLLFIFYKLSAVSK